MTIDNPIKPVVTGSNKPDLKASAQAALAKAAKESTEAKVKAEYKKIEELRDTQREHRKSISQLDQKIEDIEAVIDEIVREYESRY